MFIAKYTVVIQKYLHCNESRVWPVVFSNTPASFLRSGEIQRLLSLEANFVSFPGP